MSNAWQCWTKQSTSVATQAAPEKTVPHFPLIVKPVAEGSSKGVLSKSVCHSEAKLRYDAPAKIEPAQPASPEAQQRLDIKA